MNVLVGILKYPPDFTGAGLRIHRLYCNLQKKDIKKVYVITTSLNKRINKHNNYEGIDVIYVGYNKYQEKQKNFISRCLKFLFVLKSFLVTIITFSKIKSEIDIIHTVDSSWLSTFIGWCAYFTNKPLVKEVVLLGTDDPLALRKKKLISRFFLFPFKYAKLIIIISEPLKEVCIAFGLSPHKIWCRYNPVYLDESEPSRTEKEFLSKIDFSIPSILWVGVIQRRKNVKFLVECSEFLKGNIQLLFVGPQEDSSYFQEIQQVTKRVIQVTNGRIKILFLGRIDNRRILTSLYKKSRLFWFASFSEGLGNVIIESLMCGTPIVTLPVNGIMKYLIEDSREGEIVDTNNPKCFAEIVNECLYNKAYDRNSISERAKSKFNPEQVEDEYLCRLRSIANRKK